MTCDLCSGKTGSIKLWPETTLRCLASEADVQLPYSRNPISEAVNSLLHRAGMMTSYPSTLGPAPFGEWHRRCCECRRLHCSWATRGFRSQQLVVLLHTGRAVGAVLLVPLSWQACFTVLV